MSLEQIIIAILVVLLLGVGTVAFLALRVVGDIASAFMRR